MHPRLGEVQVPFLIDAAAVVVNDIGEDDGDEVKDVSAELLGLTNKICCLIDGISSKWKSALLTLIPESESTLHPMLTSLAALPPPSFLLEAEFL